MVLPEVSTIEWKPENYEDRRGDNSLRADVYVKYGEKEYHFVPKVFQEGDDWIGVAYWEYPNIYFPGQDGYEPTTVERSDPVRGTFAEALNGANAGLQYWLKRFNEWHNKQYLLVTAANRLQGVQGG